MRAVITTPATVANLGPGFDILALALELENEVVAEVVPGAALTIDPGPDAQEELRDPRRNLVARAYALGCQRLGADADGVRLRCVNRIPFARGMGSSAAATLGGVLAAHAVHSEMWEANDVLACVAAIEGHADNAAAALLGGLAICAPGLAAVRMDVPGELTAVVFAPHAELPTEQSRQVVPRSFSREDAVFNAARCALWVRALALRDYTLLGEAMDDRWHQPARAALLPGLPVLIAAARSAGARGAALAGAGPSVIALTDGPAEAIADALTSTGREHGIAGTIRVSKIRNSGAGVHRSG
ncbi:MAG: homoserine kinase [Candidatus Dormibacteria bacterium]